MLHWLDHVFLFQHPVYRRERSEERAGLMPVNKDMGYRFTDKLRLPGSGLNRVTFVRQRLVPCGSLLYRIGVCPAAELSGSNPEYSTGLLLGKALGECVVYDINHSSFNLFF